VANLCFGVQYRRELSDFLATPIGRALSVSLLVACEINLQY
jgi:hypothetical protein